MKVTGNVLITTIIETLGEAYVLRRKCGVDPHTFLETGNGARFNSPVYACYGNLIADERCGPAGRASA